jgi:hypothetical protein
MLEQKNNINAGHVGTGSGATAEQKEHQEHRNRDADEPQEDPASLAGFETPAP